MKQNLTTLKKIQHCIRKTLMPVKETGLDWQITKNLSKLDRYLDDKTSDFKKLEEKFHMKDENGKVILFSCTATANGSGLAIWDKDESGDFIILKDSKTHTAMPRIDDSNGDFEKAVEDFENDIEFEFHMLDDIKIKEAFESGKFSGIDLTPLVGYLINENI